MQDRRDRRQLLTTPPKGAEVYHVRDRFPTSTPVGRVFARQHLQIVDFAGHFRFRNAIQELAHARVRSLPATLAGFHWRRRYPLSSRIMRSAIRKALASSWVTTSMVMRNAFFSFRISSSRPAAMMGSSPAEGSSKNRISGIHGQGAGDGGAFFHAAAQLGGHVVFKARKAHLVELQPNHDLDGRIVELGVFVQGQGDIFADGHRAEERAALKRHAHFLAQLVALSLVRHAPQSFSRESRFRRSWGVPAPRACAAACFCRSPSRPGSPAFRRPALRN